MMRLTALELDNFKNVRHGCIGLSNCADGSCFDNSDIVGIYGQNGSGKTSIIAALFILKALFQGDELPEDLTEECIAVGADAFTIRCEGVIESDRYPFVPWRYEVRVGRSREGGCVIAAERVWCKRVRALKQSMALVFDYEREGEGGFSIGPKAFWESLSSLDKKLPTQVAVAQALSDEKSTSLFFSWDLYRPFSYFFDLFIDGDGEAFSPRGREIYETHGYYVSVLQLELHLFALRNMVVLPPSNQVYSIVDLLAVFTHEGSGGLFADCCFKIDLTEPDTLEVEMLEALEKTVTTINGVLGALVPGLSVSIEKLGAALLDDGERGERIEVVATRNGVTVPLRCESEGIKRLVSILNLLVDVYANPSACVAIDELDAGIFEYLLGEILQVLEERGKGQLIFTAHNLRPLETISKKSIVFTTTNPDNRYIPFKGLKASNNLRNQYLRAVYLGGQDEEIYEPTSKFAIDNAFYDAGVSLGVER
ncbi:hypothetical protein [uncultured Adlercreutzia sp.]|uniref:hypothetical protein n=1 Tax=uncultured Adlercreutzia sp. TaxID=875803 RepID=UPI0026F39192|nr:hypothetical protein [uncultured Adlercreutzia sp.]